MAAVLRGDIVWADLNPVRGSEQAGLRPVLILSADVFNRRSGTVVAVALTSQPPRAGFPLNRSPFGSEAPEEVLGQDRPDPDSLDGEARKTGGARHDGRARASPRRAQRNPGRLRVAIDNMYRRRRLGPPLAVRLLLSLPPAVLFPALGFFYVAFLDNPRRPRPSPGLALRAAHGALRDEGHRPRRDARPPRHAAVVRARERGPHGDRLAVREVGTSPSLSGALSRPARDGCIMGARNAVETLVGVGHPTRYWHAVEDGRIQCDVCPKECRLKEGQLGHCFVRGRQGDAIVLTTYGRSSGFCVDPIEKKPLNHFLPGLVGPLVRHGRLQPRLPVLPELGHLEVPADRHARGFRLPRAHRRLRRGARLPERRLHVQRSGRLHGVRHRRGAGLPRSRASSPSP